MERGDGGGGILERVYSSSSAWVVDGNVLFFALLMVLCSRVPYVARFSSVSRVFC